LKAGSADVNFGCSRWETPSSITRIERNRSTPSYAKSEDRLTSALTLKAASTKATKCRWAVELYRLGPRRTIDSSSGHDGRAAWSATDVNSFH
jgi:hypothetical protein